MTFSHIKNVILRGGDEMEELIKAALLQDLRILDSAGIEYDILKITPMQGYDVYEIKIVCDKPHIDMVIPLQVLKR
jgi:hypothetical protein